jgi:hypothetical protein
MTANPEEILDAVWRMEAGWVRPADVGCKLTDLWPRIALRCMNLLAHNVTPDELRQMVEATYENRYKHWATAAYSAIEAQAKPTVRKTWASADALTRAANTAALLAALQGSLSITPPRDG